jgi:hypothetical protein
MLGRIKFAIEPLVNEILDQLPREVWTSATTTFLDPAMGGGQFVKEIERRLREAGHSDSNISGRVYGCETSLLSVKYALNKYKLLGKYNVGDFLAQDFSNMKFDVIVGNPPYQKADDDSSFTNLWADFTLKAYSLSNRYIGFISPKTWANQVTKENNSSNVFKLIKRHAIAVNIDECARHFPNVGSSFTWYVLDKNKCFGESVLQTKEFTGKIDWSKIEFVPKNFSPICISILSKLLNDDYFEYMASAGTVGNLVSKKDTAHKYSVRYSYGTEKWSDTEHKYQFVKKLVFPNQTTKNFPIYAPESAPANRGVFFVVTGVKHADSMLKYFQSPVIQFLVSQQRTHHGVLNTSVIRRIPKFDVMSKWTNTNIYQHFGLTKEEIDYIESNVK